MRLSAHILSPILEIPGQVINREYSEMLMENGSLDLLTVVLLDRVQKGKPLKKDAFKKLRDQKLVEGCMRHKTKRCIECNTVKG